MKIYVTGTRGIPGIPGGVERHCQELYPLIAARGHEVTVATRSPYIMHKTEQWNGVYLDHLHAFRRKSLEAIAHTFMAVIRARLSGADILHIHAVGPGLLVLMARLLRLRVVLTNHGPDYDRQKWGRLAKKMLRLGEWCGGRYAHEVIVISKTIQNNITQRCARQVNLIYNGVSLPRQSNSTAFLQKIKVQPGGYILAVSRLVPEKGLHLLIEAFKDFSAQYQLVIAGDADHETAYSRDLKKKMAADSRIVHAGYIYGENLNQVYTNACLFVLPSFHEGLPIALLEAMSFGLSALVSDIPANVEVELPAERYFRTGSASDLKNKMAMLLEKKISSEERLHQLSMISNKYNWNTIAEQTIEVYENVIKNRKSVL